MHFLLAVTSGLTLYTVASLVPATLLDVAAFGSANELAASLEAGNSFGDCLARQIPCHTLQTGNEGISSLSPRSGKLAFLLSHRGCDKPFLDLNPVGSLSSSTVKLRLRG